MKKLIAKIREILRNRRVRRIWMRTVSSIAGLVVFVTTYALVLPAITMESEAACGMEAHQHDDSCYEERLICDLPESDGHTHTEECYDDAGSLVCGLEESEGHHHDASCYEKVLICGKEVHTHSPACYREDAASTAATERAAVTVTVPGVMDENGAADDAGDTGITDNTDNTDNTGIDGTTGALEIADPAETAAEGYVPALDELDFRQLLNDSTAIYYHRAADDPETKTEAAAAEAEAETGHEIETEKEKENEKEPENSGQITDWQKVDEDTELGENDILRVYLAYTIPAGSLNETNPVARYRLPANIHLTDEQIDAINRTENGLSSLYVDYETLQITDPENHSAYLGAEAVEGLRTPDQTVEEYSGSNRNDHNDRSADSNAGDEDQAAQEFISAVVKADQIYDEEGLYGEKGALLGTDLVFTFSPYTILKNRNEYDSEGTPVKAGESVSGWFTLDFNMDQVDWNGNDHTTAEITFVSDNEENKELGISPISVTLHKADPADPASEEKTDEDHTDAAEETHPAVSFEDSLTVHTGSLNTDATTGTLPASSKLTVSVSAEAGTFPAGTTMVLSAVPDMDAVAEAVEGTVDSKTCGFQAVDISFRDKDGNEIEPLKPISVTMRSDSIKAATEDSSMAPVVVHVEDRDKDKDKAETGDSPTATVIETFPDTTEKKENTEKQSEAPDVADTADAISFEADAFSVYAIVYTVDFFFNINGKEYAFSLEGGDSTSFKEIIDRFEILEKENVDLFINNISTVEFSNPDYLWNGRLEEDAFAGELKEKNNLDIQYASNIREGNILAMNVHHYSAPDWVLIALKPFSSEETLSITMKNGEKFTVKVTDAQSDAFHNTDGTVQTIPNPQGTTFELFNYYVSEDTKTTAGRDQWPGHIHDDNEFWKFNWYNFDGSYERSWNDGFWYNDAEVPETWRQQHLLGYGNNLGINKNHNFKFSPANAGTVIDGTKGTVTKDVDGGSGLNGWTQDADPNQGLVQNKLSNGYPILTNNSSKGTDGTSLAYLFDNTTHEGKDSYGNVNNLLYVDPDGYYTYDSRDFKAEYQNNGTFKLTDQPDTTDTEVKGFWPFGTKVYWSGLHMNTQFSMPENGQVLNPKDELKDMQFKFSGDDDTWLYVDGVLVGDGGGIHNRTEIDVNFATGKVIVTGLEDTVHTGSFYQEKWLDQIFIDAGQFNDSDWEDIGDGSGHKRFKAGTYHTFDMFYLERGGGESNLYIHYNLVSTDDFTGHKSYEGFADGERMARDQFHFELIGLDGQYQSVWNETTQSADVSLVSATERAIMPGRGSETGTGSYADPKKVYSSVAYTDSDGHTIGGTILTSGVLENGDIRFGSANISADEMLACDQGHPSVYRYIIREIVPDDAVNDDGITWAEATDEQKEAGGFVKDQVLYDREVYYMTAGVTSWNQTGSDGQTYKAYGLSKTYYTDDTFTKVDNSVSFVDFRNIYAPESGSVEFTKVDGSNHHLQGAVFTLYTDEACTKIAKDLGDAENGVAGVNQVKTSGTDGKVSFENMAAPRTYYMKETTVPTGYSANNTVYKVIIEDHKDHTKSSRILINADGSETEINKIVNTKDGELSVIKEWHDQNGNVVDGGSKTARVKIQRKKYQAGSSENPHTVYFTIKIDGRDDLVYTYTATNIIGKMVTIDWWDTNQSISSITVNGNSASVTENYWDDTNHKNRKLVIENVNTDVNVTVVYPSDISWLFDGDHGRWMKNVSVAGSGLSYELTPDTAFNSSTENSHFATLSSPGWNKTWTLGTGKDFPSSDGINDYVYYVIEVDNEGNELEADKETELGYKLIKYSASNETGVVNQGSIVIYNEIDTPLTTDINIKKVKEDGSTGLSGAIFRLKVLNGSYQYVSGVTGYTEISGIGNVTVDDVVYSDALLTNGNIQSITGLPDGTYQLEEVKTPNGYINTIGSIEFKVEGGVITSQTAENSDKVDLDTTGTIGLLTITNTPGAALPNTGGPGTRLFTILGSILIAGAGVMLVRRRRRLI